MSGTIRLLVPTAENAPSAIAHHVRGLQAAGRSVLYLAADRPYRQVAAQFAQAGVDVSTLHFVDVVTCMDGKVPAVRPPNTLFLPSPTMLEMMAMRIEQVTARLADPVVVVDSLNTLALYNGPSAVQEFSHYLANRLRARGVSGDFVLREGRDAASLRDQVATFTDEQLVLGVFA